MSDLSTSDRTVSRSKGFVQPDLDVRLVFEGQIATFEVAGGFARKPVPVDGVIVETTTATIFIPISTLVEVMGQGLEKTEKSDANT